MAKKFKIDNDSPVTVCLALLLLLAFALDSFALNGKLLASILTCPGGKLSSPSFSFSSGADYIKLLLHVFGSSSWTPAFVNSLFVLLLGPELEERYGSPVFALMLAVSSLVTGVLNACLSPSPVFGASCAIFTMIFLTGMTDLAKKRIRISWILVFSFYIIYQLYSVYSGSDVRLSSSGNGFLLFMKKNAVTFISLAGGICGSLFGFLVSPKKRSAPRKNFDDTELESDSSSAPEKSSFFGKKHSLLKKTEKARKSSSNDETVIGTISL